MIYNTAYKIKVDNATDEERLLYNIEEGAFVTTSSGVWTVYDGEWVKLYPQAGESTGIGWTRYDDDEYVSGDELILSDGVEVTLPNNGADIYRSYEGINYYNPTTQKVLCDKPNDVYVFTVVFKASAAQANQTFLRLQLDAVNGTPYERIGTDFIFPRGNNVEHKFHQLFQYYTTQDFIDNGSQWKIESMGGSVKVWDIIYFIQKTQSYA